MSYRTVLNLLCVSYTQKEEFWEYIKRGNMGDNFECYEVRLKEIANTHSNYEKSWKIQKVIEAGKKGHNYSIPKIVKLRLIMQVIRHIFQNMPLSILMF
jgi:uncharacterized protein involved in tolerance to divalent cations